MDVEQIQKLQQYLLAARALHRSVERSLHEGLAAGVGRMAVKQYNGIQRKVAEMFPDDFYITDTLTLEVNDNTGEEHMVGQVQLAASQLILYLEGLIRESRQDVFGASGFTRADVDNLRNLGRDISDQIINMTKTTLRKALSNVDVDVDFDADFGGKRDNVDLEGADLENGNFSGHNMRGAHMAHANLRNSNFSGTHLAEANLEGVQAEGANFSGANLRDANLEHAFMRGANLTGANLRGANMDAIDLSGANLTGANLRDVNLEHANLQGARLDGAELRDANLEGAEMSGARLDGANLRDANLHGAKLPEDFGSMGVHFGHGSRPRPPRPPRPPESPFGRRRIQIEIDRDDEPTEPPVEKPKNDDVV